MVQERLFRKKTIKYQAHFKDFDFKTLSPMQAYSVEDIIFLRRCLIPYSS